MTSGPLQELQILGGWQSCKRLLAVVATIVLLGIGAVEAVLVHRAIVGGWHGPYGQDYALYMDFTRTWLSTGEWYLPEQLAGPYVIEELEGNAYPPTLLYLTVPFALGVPAVVWWVMPIAIFLLALRRVRPAWWAWPVLAFILVYPRSWTLIAIGNPSIWAFAAMMAGFAWGWPALGATLKLTLAPFAIVGAHHRSWRAGLVVLTVLALPLWQLWIEYLAALSNGTSERGFAYILGEIPIALAITAVGASRTR